MTRGYLLSEAQQELIQPCLPCRKAKRKLRDNVVLAGWMGGRKWS